MSWTLPPHWLGFQCQKVLRKLLRDGGLRSLTQLCNLSTIKPIELPGKMCPLVPSSTIVLETTKCFLIGLEAHCTRWNTYLVLRSGQKTTDVEVTAVPGR